LNFWCGKLSLKYFYFSALNQIFHFTLDLNTQFLMHNRNVFSLFCTRFSQFDRTDSLICNR
jgi:hypothetical protein